MYVNDRKIKKEEKSFDFFEEQTALAGEGGTKNLDAAQVLLALL